MWQDTIYTLLRQIERTLEKKNHAAYRYRYRLHDVLGIKGCHIVSVVSTACMLVCMPDPGRARNEMMDDVLEDLLPNFDGSHTSQKVGIGPCFPLCSIHSTFNSTSGRGQFSHSCLIEDPSSQQPWLVFVLFLLSWCSKCSHTLQAGKFSNQTLLL